MKTAAEIRAEISALGVSYRAIEDKAKAENREVTAEEGAEIDRLFAEKQKLDAQLVEVEKSEARRRDAANAFAGSASAAARTVGDRNPANTAGFRDIGEFARAVHAAHPQVGGGVDPRLNQLAPPAEYHREGGSTDGYLVPTDFRNGIWNAVDEAGDILGLVNAETTSGNQVSMLKDETTPWGAAGIEAHWTAEGAKLKAPIWMRSRTGPMSSTARSTAPPRPRGPSRPSPRMSSMARACSGAVPPPPVPAASIRGASGAHGR